jgi:hypothetical protein
VAVIANRVITPIAVIGSRVDLAVNDPVKLSGERVLLRRGARDEGSDAQDDPGAATSLRGNPEAERRTDADAEEQPKN